MEKFKPPFGYNIKHDPSKQDIQTIINKLDEIVDWINQYEKDRNRNQIKSR